MKIVQFTIPCVLFALFLQTLAFADRLTSQNSYYPKSFYSQVENGTSDEELKKELFEILSSGHIPSPHDSDKLVKSCRDQSRDCYQHSPISYSQARDFVLGKLDLMKKDGKYALKDVYCEDIFTEDDFKKGLGPQPGKAPDHNVFNVEHTWPQSRFSKRFSKAYQKPDMHILYGVSKTVNTSRGNDQFAEIQTDKDPVCPAVRRGWVRGDRDEIYFEPPAEHRGNVARALFYFSVRYQLPISKIEEESLRNWNKQDPVNEEEKVRHEEIFKVQKVRNPFIDHPELVDIIADF